LPYWALIPWGKMEINQKKKKIIREILQRPEADCFIGYARQEISSVVPVVIRSAEEVDRLVWNDQCFHNLTTFLPRYSVGGKITGIMVKGCDARALRELIRANQVERSKLYIVGIPCRGLKETGTDKIAQRCYGCRYPQDFSYDAVLGPMQAPQLPASGRKDRLLPLSNSEKYNFWKKELAKCIRCDACQKICYGCFCPECIFDSRQPRWLAGRQDFEQKFFFHTVRAFHLAGRCIGCGECERVCPAGIELMLLNSYLQMQAEQMFGYEGVGVKEEIPPLLNFSRDDPDPFKEVTR